MGVIGDIADRQAVMPTAAVRGLWTPAVHSNKGGAVATP